MRPSIQTVIRKPILAAMFILALAASLAAAPQRGAGHFGNGAAGRPVGSGSRAQVAVPHAQVRVPERHVVVPRGHVVVPHSRVIVRGGFYDPFFGPDYPVLPGAIPMPIRMRIRTERTILR